MSTHALALALLALALAGCLGAPEPVAPAGLAPLADLPADPPALPAAFDVLSRAGGRLRIDALAWFPSEVEKTAVLAIHGSGGCRDCWGGVGVEGYSFAARELARGRALVAIHLPGYGDSAAPGGAVSQEDYAFVTDQVADALRSGSYTVEGAEPRGFPKVVGIGISMGGLVVNLAQGLFGSFDAIVPMSWSHGGFRREYLDCVIHDASCPEDPRSINFHLPNADPAVIDAAGNRSRTPPLVAGVMASASLVAWSGCVECVHEALRPLQGAPGPDDVTRDIRVPVLAILGAEDFYWDPEGMEHEPEHYPNAADFTFLQPEATGHVVHLHLNAAEVQGAIGDWLDERGFGFAG